MVSTTVAICENLTRGNIKLAEYLLPPGKCVLDYSEHCSNPEVIEWMFDCGYLKRDQVAAVEAIHYLAQVNQLDLMQRIAELYYPPPRYMWEGYWNVAIERTCECGDLQTLQWLIRHPVGHAVCALRDINGTLSNFAWLALRRKNNQVEVLQYLYANWSIVDDYEEAMLFAVDAGQMDVIKWLLEHLPISDQLAGYCVMDTAAGSGHLEILQFFQRLQLSTIPRCSWKYLQMDRPIWCSTRAMDSAAANGHFEIVKWLHGNRPEGCTTGAMDGAATNGHLEILKWLQSNRDESCTIAAMDGAATNGHLDVLRWLHENVMSESTVTSLDGAESRGHFEIVKWVYENRPVKTTTVAMDTAASRGDLEMVQWLHANMIGGCTTNATDFAACQGHLEMVKWLSTNRFEGCTVSAIDTALKFGHLSIASWLHDHFPELVPTKLGQERSRDILVSFDELLFRYVYYDDVTFIHEFCYHLESSANREDDPDLVNWVKEKIVEQIR